MASDSADQLLAGSVFEVARRLLGCRVRTEFGGAVTEVAITEVEAYDGSNDPASHAYRGPTERTRTMFGPPGRLYVYRSYGVHWCMNVVTGPEGTAGAVLLRGGRPVMGEAAMTRRRGKRDHLTDGPGKLCQAMGVEGHHDGVNVTDGEVRLSHDRRPPRDIVTTPRVGISKAVDYPWRFGVRG